MPELPEVETVVRTLSPRIAGRRMVGVELICADIVEPVGTDIGQAYRGESYLDYRPAGEEDRLFCLMMGIDLSFISG